jgi:PA14 domain
VDRAGEGVATGNHTFSTVVNDGVRLWVDGQPLINSWINRLSSATITAAPIALTAGVSYTITMEFYDRSGNATAKLRWADPGRSTQIIPQSRLYP